MIPCVEQLESRCLLSTWVQLPNSPDTCPPSHPSRYAREDVDANGSMDYYYGTLAQDQQGNNIQNYCVRSPHEYKSVLTLPGEIERYLIGQCRMNGGINRRWAAGTQDANGNWIQLDQYKHRITDGGGDDRGINLWNGNKQFYSIGGRDYIEFVYTFATGMLNVTHYRSTGVVYQTSTQHPPDVTSFNDRWVEPAIPQTIPYTQSFDSLPNWEQGWEFNAGGLITIVNGQLQMADRSTHSGYSQNTAILHLDLSGQSHVVLTGYHDNVKDETHSRDGIFAGGVNLLTDLVHDGTFTVELPGPYTSDYEVTFSQYDNYSIAYDGRRWDDLFIYSKES